jgi:putative polyhydroxyalkanoate system protein
MPSISIVRTHTLSHTKAREAAEKVARDLEKRFELAYDWDGDHVVFERPGVSGRMLVAKDRIALDVKLGLLLTPLKPAIEREINAQLDKLFADKPRPKPKK